MTLGSDRKNGSEVEVRQEMIFNHKRERAPPTLGK